MMFRDDSPGQGPTPSAILGTLLLAAILAAPAASQYGSYVVPGSLAERSEQTREVLLKQLEDSRWRLGPVRIDPVLSVGDVGWVNNIFSSSDEEAEGDLRARASAGLRASINLGPKVVASSFADASYHWWRDQEDLRSRNDSLGLQLFGLFNRLQVQVQGGRVETQGNLNNEVEVPVDLQSDRFEVGFDVDPRGPFLIFGAASTGRISYFGEAAERAVPGLDLETLNRDIEALSLGLRYELSTGLSIGLGAEQTESEFEEDVAGRSSKSFGPLLRLGFQAGRLSLNIDSVWRRIEFRGRDAAPDREQLTGVGRLGWEFTDRLSGSVYATRFLDFSALDPRAAFDGARSGISLARTTERRRIRLRLFYEVGADEFFDIASDQITRRDDFEAYGAGLRWDVNGRLSLDLAYTDSRRESTDPEFDRSLRALTSAVRLGGNLLPW